MTDQLKKIDHDKKYPYFRVYRPRLYRLNVGCFGFTWLFLACGLALVYSVGNGDHGADAVFLFFAVFLLSIISFKILFEIRTDTNRKFEKRWRLERDQVLAQTTLRNAMDDAKAKDLGRSIINNTININASGHATVNSNVVNGDLLNGSIQELKQNDVDLEEALETIAGYIQVQGSERAKAAFNDFNKNVAEKSSEGTLRLLWKGVVELLPDAVKVTEAAMTLGKFFGLP